MSKLMKVGAIALAGLLQVPISTTVLAQPSVNMELIDRNLSIVRANGIPDSMIGVPVDDLRSGERVIGMPADSESTTQWRRESIRSLWRETRPGLLPLSDDQLNQIMAGDLGDVPNDIINGYLFVLGGTPTLKLSSVGMLLLGIDGRYFPHCTGVLTRSDTFLTARHCVSNLHSDESLKVYFPYEGIRDPVVDGITQFCEDGDSGCSSTIDDLALVTLSEPYSFLPLVNPGPGDSANPGSSAKILGFGLNNESLSDNGVLREGSVMLDGCNACQNENLVGTDPSAGGRLLCFDYATDGIAGIDGNTVGNLGGDSGGPMLATDVNPNALIGISSRVDWACNDSGEQEGKYVNTTNPVYQAWMATVYCTFPCADGSADVVDLLVHEAAGMVGENLDQVDYVVPVWPWTKSLVLSLNHEINGYDPNPNDLELVLPDGLEAQCEQHDGVEVCTATNPDSGDYEISVKKKYGNPAYQLTVSAIRCPDLACWNQGNSSGMVPSAPGNLQAY
jgi:hypothetical protein